MIRPPMPSSALRVPVTMLEADIMTSPSRLPRYRLRACTSGVLVWSSRTAASRSLCQAEDGEWPVHGPAGPPGGFGDVGASGQAQGADGQVAHGCHDPRPGPGSYLGVILLVESVADPVQRLDCPLAAHMAGPGRAAGPGPGVAGPAPRGHRRGGGARHVADVALRPQDPRALP